MVQPRHRPCGPAGQHQGAGRHDACVVDEQRLSGCQLAAVCGTVHSVEVMLCTVCAGSFRCSWRARLHPCFCTTALCSQPGQLVRAVWLSDKTAAYEINAVRGLWLQNAKGNSCQIVQALCPVDEANAYANA